MQGICKSGPPIFPIDELDMETPAEAATIQDRGEYLSHIVRLALDVRLLGPLQVFDGAGHSVALSGGRPRALLALLALELPGFVSVDRIIEALWGDEAGRALDGGLHVTMSRLRKTLGEDVIRAMAGGYRLELPVTNLDVERFRRHARRGRQLLTLGNAARLSPEQLTAASELASVLRSHIDAVRAG